MTMYHKDLPEVTEFFHEELASDIFYEERTQEFFAGFPHVGKKLTAFWGKKEFRPYIKSLINDSSRPNRRGFPSNCMLILFRMLETHDEKFPYFKDKSTVWDDMV